MSTGYTRQSVADIVIGVEVKAAPINNEFNAIDNAFDETTGHNHDGSAGAGQKIPLATAVTGYLPLANGGVAGKNNATAADPTTGDDSDDGYAVGSIWVNTTNKRQFICLDASVGAAVWREIVLITSDGVSVDAKSLKITSVGTPAASTDAATKGYVDTKSLDTFTVPAADMNINSQKLTNVADPVSAQDAATKNYVDTKPLNTIAVPVSSVSFNSQKITGLADPTLAQDGATKNYVDTRKLSDFVAPASDLNINSKKLTNVATGTSSGDAVNKAQLDAAIFTGALPGQIPAVAGYFVRTDGANATWYDLETTIDSRDTTTLNSAKSYADTKDATTLATANAYADAAEVAANGYTDTVAAAAIVTANGYTDTVAATTLATANGYTDSEITAFGDGLKYVTRNTTYTAVSGDHILADVSGGAFTINLPATPANYDIVHIGCGAGLYSTNNLTIGRNGSTIMGLSEDMIVNTDNISFSLVYNGSTWRLV